MMTMDCFICRYVSGREFAEVVYSDDVVFAMMSPSPANPGHVLILPAQHIERLGEMTEEGASHLFTIAMRMQRAIEKSSIKCDGMYLALAEGEGTFQIVPHIYVDLVPRFRHDRYWMLATIDEPYARPAALFERLLSDRARDKAGARSFYEAEARPERISAIAAQIREAYAAIWSGPT